MSSQRVRVQPGEIQSQSAALAAEALQAFQLLQRFQSRQPPDFGLVCRKMFSDSEKVTQRLGSAFELTLTRLQKLAMLVKEAGVAYEQHDKKAARRMRANGGR